MKPDLKNLDLDKLKRGVAERIPHVSVEMNRKRWIVLVCALLAAGGGVWWWLRPRPVPEVLPVVAAEPVEVEDVSVYGEYVGRIRAQQFVEIRARVEGYLERMLFTEGTYIKKGSQRRALLCKRLSANCSQVSADSDWDSTDLNQAGRLHGSHSGNPAQGHNGHMTAMCSILETVLT